MLQSLIQTLTPREFQVLRLVSEQMTNDEIAAEFYVSPHTIHTHIAVILHKLRVHKRRNAANLFRQEIARNG